MCTPIRCPNGKLLSSENEIRVIHSYKPSPSDQQLTLAGVTEQLAGGLSDMQNCS